MHCYAPSLTAASQGVNSSVLLASDNQLCSRVKRKHSGRRSQVPASDTVSTCLGDIGGAPTMAAATSPLRINIHMH